MVGFSVLFSVPLTEPMLSKADDLNGCRKACPPAMEWVIFIRVIMINLNYPLLKPVRMLLLPFSLIYGLIIYIRNWMFDKNLLRSSSFNLPVICIGNLAVGGTGKSPMVEFLIGKLKGSFRLAVLSRGYKRKTSGYALATNAKHRAGNRG